MTEHDTRGEPLLQGVDEPGGGGADPNNRDVGGAHGRDEGAPEESGPNRDVGGEHGRDSGEGGVGGSGDEPGPDRDVGGAHGRDQGEH